MISFENLNIKSSHPKKMEKNIKKCKKRKYTSDGWRVAGF